MTKVIIDIEDCMSCPFHETARRFISNGKTSFDWFCTHEDVMGYSGGKTIAENVDQKIIPIPDWCPIRFKDDTKPAYISRIPNKPSSFFATESMDDIPMGFDESIDDDFELLEFDDSIEGCGYDQDDASGYDPYYYPHHDGFKT